jgi:acyl dehydratase
LHYFEDFPAGEVVEFGDREVTAEEIIAFARQFDPQPFHLSEEAGRASVAGGLIASGWHTASMMMRIICDAMLFDAAGQGSPGMDAIDWLKPVRPGDRLRVRMHVIDKRASNSRPEMGFVNARLDMLNAGDVRVMTLTPHFILGRRSPSAGDGEKAGA